jgi:hypothetical protein
MGGLQGYDPLDAFMAGIQEEVKANKPTERSKANACEQLDEADDHVADFMEVGAACSCQTGLWQSC